MVTQPTARPSFELDAAQKTLVETLQSTKNSNYCGRTRYILTQSGYVCLQCNANVVSSKLKVHCMLHWMERNKERRFQYRQQYYRAHKEKLKQYQRDYRIKYPEKIKLLSSKYHAKHKAEDNARSARYEINNKAKLQAYRKQYNARPEQRAKKRIQSARYREANREQINERERARWHRKQKLKKLLQAEMILTGLTQRPVKIKLLTVM